MRPKGKLLSPERRRRGVNRLQQTFGVSERRACKVLHQPRSTQRRPLLTWPVSMVGTGIAELPPCLDNKAGRSITNVYNASGGKKVWKFRKNNRSEQDYGSMRVRVYACAPHTGIMSGRMILSWTAPMKATPFVCSPSSMNTPMNV